MTIVLFGEDVFTTAALQSLINQGYKVSLVVCPFYQNNNHKNLQSVAEENKITFLRETDVNSPALKDHILSIQPDLIISVHLRKILYKEIFSIAKTGAINVHPSLLPKYRGLSPQHQAIIHGDPESAVTVHFIEEGVDTGDIIIQERIPLNEADYIHDFQLKMLAVYKHIVVDAVKRISDKSFKPVKQNSLDTSYFGSIKKKDREIDFNKSKIDALNRIRAFSFPYKGACYDQYIIWKAEIPNADTEKELLKAYVTTGIYLVEEEQIILRFADGILISDDFEMIEN